MGRSRDGSPEEDPAGGPDPEGGEHHDELVDLGPAEDETEHVLSEAEQVLEEAEHHRAEATAEGGEGDEETFVDGTVAPSALAAERDEYLEALRRVKAEFDNYKKRVTKQSADARRHASAQLMTALLPVLDSCDAAIGQGATDVEPIYKSLLEVLTKEGLEVMQPDGEPFDPHLHEAVMHEEGDGGESVVAETLRTGYAVAGQVLRPAMVKVRG